MPTYKYRCNRCDTHVTLMHKMTENKAVICPRCKEPMTIELQPTYFRVNGYNADNGYSGGNNNE